MTRCLLTVHAHPDDEASKGAGTVSRYHDEGVRTVLVCCTGGEEGDILNPAMDRPEVRENLGKVRAEELRRAAAIIGYDEVVMLGYRDSGMPGSEANARPEAFANAPLEEAVGRLVEIIRRERPEVIVTYPEEQNEYPHPDHLRVHEVTMAAWEAAADSTRFADVGEPHAVAKVYYTVWPRQRMREMHAKFVEFGVQSPFDEKWMERLEKAADDPVTTTIHLGGYEDVRGEALKAHATQVDPKSPFWFGLPPEVLRDLYPYDDYLLARNRVGPVEVEEHDLFAGIS